MIDENLFFVLALVVLVVAVVVRAISVKEWLDECADKKLEAEKDYWDMQLVPRPIPDSVVQMILTSPGYRDKEKENERE